MTSFTLSKPLTVNGQTYASFTFREPTAGDLAMSDRVEGDINKTLAMMASIADVPIQVMKAVPLRDFNRLSTAVAPLLGEPETAADGQT